MQVKEFVDVTGTKLFIYFLVSMFLSYSFLSPRRLRRR